MNQCPVWNMCISSQSSLHRILIFAQFPAQCPPKKYPKLKQNVTFEMVQEFIILEHPSTHQHPPQTHFETFRLQPWGPNVVKKNTHQKTYIMLQDTWTKVNPRWWKHLNLLVRYIWTGFYNCAFINGSFARTHRSSELYRFRHRPCQCLQHSHIQKEHTFGKYSCILLSNQLQDEYNKN